MSRIRIKSAIVVRDNQSHASLPGIAFNVTVQRVALECLTTFDSAS